mmetsp:Transcript_38347/g.151574  ORF Transcript_38347/g.151574 Transcript_38347/m.151574 type:complete len:219 (-) Transcript_38347:109-765(-)
MQLLEPKAILALPRLILNIWMHHVHLGAHSTSVEMPDSLHLGAHFESLGLLRFSLPAHGVDIDLFDPIQSGDGGFVRNTVVSSILFQSFLTVSRIVSLLIARPALVLPRAWRFPALLSVPVRVLGLHFSQRPPGRPTTKRELMQPPHYRAKHCPLDFIQSSSAPLNRNKPVLKDFFCRSQHHITSSMTNVPSEKCLSQTKAPIYLPTFQNVSFPAHPK